MNQTQKRGPKPTISRNGLSYTCKRWSVEIPDFESMSDLAVSVWLNQNTIPMGRGIRTTPVPNIAGLTLKVGA